MTNNVKRNVSKIVNYNHAVTLVRKSLNVNINVLDCAMKNALNYAKFVKLMIMHLMFFLVLKMNKMQDSFK